MASIVKRLASGVLAVWFTVFSVVFPVTAHAVTYNAASNFTGRIWAVPFVGTGIAGSRIAAAAATVITRANPWIAGISIGTMLVQTVIELKTGGTIGIVSDGQLTTPIPGWGDSNTPPPTATPLVGAETVAPTISSPCGTGYAYETAQGMYCTPSAACQAAGYTGVWTINTTTFYCGNYSSKPVPYVKVNEPLKTCPAGWTLTGDLCVSGTTCPVGYAMTGGQCTLTDVPKVQWPSDGQPTYVPRVGTDGVYQWWPSDRDPDQGTYPQTNLNQYLQSGDVFTDPQGNPVSQTFTPTSDGGYVHTQQIQHTPAGALNTYTTTNTYTVDKSGAVTNISTVTNNGPITNTTNNTTPVQPLPTDYNREATQAAIKEDLNKLVTGTGAETAPDYKQQVEDAKTKAEADLKEITDEIAEGYSASKGNWFSWVWSPPVGVCTPYQGSIHGKSVSWNICPYIANVRDVIGWLFALYGAWTVYNQMFKREDA